MKVYVLERGQYSDRHVIGVVLTKEEAIKICELGSDHKYKYEEITYTEWDTNQFDSGLLKYEVEYFFGEWRYKLDDWWDKYTSNTEVYENMFVIFADSPDKAIKIAQDMRAVRLAKEKGVL